MDRFVGPRLDQHFVEGSLGSRRWRASWFRLVLLDDFRAVIDNVRHRDRIVRLDRTLDRRRNSILGRLRLVDLGPVFQYVRRLERPQLHKCSASEAADEGCRVLVRLAQLLTAPQILAQDVEDGRSVEGGGRVAERGHLLLVGESGAVRERVGRLDLVDGRGPQLVQLARAVPWVIRQSDQLGGRQRVEDVVGQRRQPVVVEPQLFERHERVEQSAQQLDQTVGGQVQDAQLGQALERVHADRPQRAVAQVERVHRCTGGERVRLDATQPAADAQLGQGAESAQVLRSKSLVRRDADGADVQLLQCVEAEETVGVDLDVTAVGERPVVAPVPRPDVQVARRVQPTEGVRQNGLGRVVTQVDCMQMSQNRERVLGQVRHVVGRQVERAQLRQLLHTRIVNQF